MSRPDLSAYARIPLSSFSGVDNNVDIEGTLRTFEVGNFRQAAFLADQMLRDDRIHGLMETRIDGLTSAPMDMKPADDSSEAQKVAEVLGGRENGDGGWLSGMWEEMCPAEAIGELLRWGHMCGVGVGEILWSGKPGEWMPRIRVWHPQFVYWDWYRFAFMLITGDGVVELPKIDENPRSDGHWIVWNPHSYVFGWMHGLIRPLARPYLGRAWDWRDWARFNEAFGQPTKKGIVPAGAKLNEKQQFKDDLIASGSDGVVILERGKEGIKESGWDYELVESASTTGWNSFQQFKKDIEADMAIAILGQDLPSQSHGGGMGDGKAKSFELVRSDKRAKDARIARVIRLQLLTWWAQHNYGDPDLAPRPEYQVGDADEEAEEAAAMKALGDGLAALKAAGAPIDVRTIVERAGYPMLTEEEIAAKAAEAAAKVPQVQPAPGQKALPPKKDEAPKPAAKQLSATLPLPVKRYKFAGMAIAIEHPKDSIRLWTSDDGKTLGSTKMLADYGYLEGHTGQDGEEVDCYIGPDENAPDVHVVHQLKGPDYDTDDEDKAFLGFPDPTSAKACFLAHRNDGDRAFGGMTTLPLARFVEKMNRRQGTGKIRASADVTRAVALSGPRAKKRASRYADLLTAKAAERATTQVRSDLVPHLLEAIGAATDPADLREKLKHIARTVNVDALAALTAKTRILGHLAGRGEMVAEL